MNGYQNYRRLFVVSVVVYAIMLGLLLITLFKPQPVPAVDHPLIGHTATVHYGHAELNSYSRSSATGTVVAIDEGWITLSYGPISSITIPAHTVHWISTE